MSKSLVRERKNKDYYLKANGGIPFDI